MRLSPLMTRRKRNSVVLSRLAAEPGFEGVIQSAASTAGLDAISNVLKESTPELLGPLLSKASQVLPEERRVDLARQITSALSPAKQQSFAEEIRQGLKGPSPSVNDRLLVGGRLSILFRTRWLISDPRRRSVYSSIRGSEDRAGFCCVH